MFLVCFIFDHEKEIVIFYKNKKTFVHVPPLSFQIHIGHLSRDTRQDFGDREPILCLFLSDIKASNHGVKGLKNITTISFVRSYVSCLSFKAQAQVRTALGLCEGRNPGRIEEQPGGIVCEDQSSSWKVWRVRELHRQEAEKRDKEVVNSLKLEVVGLRQELASWGNGGMWLVGRLHIHTWIWVKISNVTPKQPKHRTRCVRLLLIIRDGLYREGSEDNCIWVHLRVSGCLRLPTLRGRGRL